MGLLIVAGFVIVALPASLVARFLPHNILARDFSGTLWHGSAASVIFNGRNAGAIEWHIHPASLLALTLNAEVRWVKNASAYDARVEVTRHAVHAYQVQGGGPIGDLRDFGIAAGWRGNLKVALSEVASDYQKLTALSGTVQASELSSPQVLAASDLGGYQIDFAPSAMSSDGNLAASLADTGTGPLETHAQITLNVLTGTGLLSGTLRERPGASAALHQQLDNLAQLKPRDAQGKIPVELEFSL
jgi:hypothetical protein